MFSIPICTDAHMHMDVNHTYIDTNIHTCSHIHKSTNTEHYSLSSSALDAPLNSMQTEKYTWRPGISKCHVSCLKMDETGQKAAMAYGNMGHELVCRWFLKCHDCLRKNGNDQVNDDGKTLWMLGRHTGLPLLYKHSFPGVEIEIREGGEGIRTGEVFPGKVCHKLIVIVVEAFGRGVEHQSLKNQCNAM